MGTAATGQLRALADGWEGRIRIDDAGTRKGFALVPFRRGDEDAARERCTAMAVMATRLRKAGHVAEIPKLLEMAAKARTGRQWDAIVAAVDAMCTGPTESIGSAPTPTFVDFARDWTSGKLHKRFPDHVAKKKNHEADEAYLTKYVEPIIHDLPIDEFTLDHADQIMANVPEERATSTRRHVAQFVRRVCALAVYPARLRRESPIPTGWLPKVKVTKAFTCLYPEEDRTLLGCAGEAGKPGVALIRRLFYGVLSREGLRRSELADLRFRDVDLEKGRIALDRNKTDDPRSWALDPSVRRALAAWRKTYRADAKPDDYVFAEAGVPLNVNRMAEELQADLKTAKVEREQLFERSASRRPIRVHDLRATFVTVSLANGKTETWVADRTGHRSSAMINRYRRSARTWAELDLGPLAPLDECIPELRSAGHAAGHAAKVTPAAKHSHRSEKQGGEGGIRTRGTIAGTHDFQGERPSEEDRSAPLLSEKPDPSRPASTPDTTPMARSWPAADAVELALADALTKATTAGEWTTVAQLARELEARRTALAGNVVQLRAAKR